MIEMYPRSIENKKFNYIKINDIYLSNIRINNFSSDIEFIYSFDNINRYTVVIYPKKQDNYNILKNINTNISKFKSEINSASNNQIDIDILDKSKSDAEKIRYEIQVNDEDIYYTNIYISICSKSKEVLLKKVNKYINRLYTKRIKSNSLNFRQLEGYISTLSLSTDKLKNNVLNLTTTNLSYLYPFYTKTIIDKNGILFGYIDGKLCVIDIFSNKYDNPNICIIGSSGSGKSFFTKSIILKHYLNGKNSYIFDAEREYINLVKYLDGEIITITKDYFNIFDFNNEINLKDNVNKVLKYICILNDFNEKEKIKLSEYITEAYKLKGIFTKDNMFKDDKAYLNSKLKSGEEIPCLNDMLEIIKEKGLKDKVKFICYKYKFLSNYSNIKYNNSLFLFDISNLDEDKSDKICYILFKEIVNNFKTNNNIIYIDEVWKFMKQNKYSANEIVNMYKTIRKKGGAICTITQDISDLFSKEFKEYGKTILNNSFIKLIFKLEYLDEKVLYNIVNFNEGILDKLTRLKKGNSLMLFQNNSIYLNIKLSKLERNIIEGEKDDNCSFR